jgi:hypothetical protein
MSTLNVTNAQITTLKDASGNNGTTPAQLASGRVQFWCKFDGSGTAAITDSFNTTSITDGGTGTYTVTIATDMANANWVAFGLSGVAGNTMTTAMDISTAAQTATAISIKTTDMAGTRVDATDINMGGVGDPV